MDESLVVGLSVGSFVDWGFAVNRLVGGIQIDSVRFLLLAYESCVV